MGVRQPFAIGSISASVAAPAAAETLIVSSPPLIVAVDGAPVMVMTSMTVLIGVGVTAINYLLRRGTTTTGLVVTGQLGGGNLSETASLTVMRTLMALDNPGSVGPVQYSFTLTSVGGASTVGSCSIAVLSL